MSRPVRPLAIAHRGGPGTHRENTLQAVEAAVVDGVEAIEVDVRLAADGTPVVVHDATFARLWTDPRPVASMTWGEIARLGRPGLRVPRLEELLEHSVATGVPLVLDQKEQAAGAASARLVERVGADRTAFCGETSALLEVRRISARACIFYNDTSSAGPDQEVVAALRPQFYNPCFHGLTAQTVAAVQRAGIGVCCWTPNDLDDLARVLDLGVDAVMTDRIDTLTALLAERGPFAARSGVSWP